MKLITVTAIRAIKLKRFLASQGEEMLIDLAIGAYGYLLRSQTPREYTFSEFADIIESHYDVHEPRNAAVVEALRTVQAQTDKLLPAQLALEKDKTCA